MIHNETHIVPANITPKRLQEYGVGVFNAVPTKSALKKALKKKYISVNGIIATTATIISGCEHIILTIPEDPTPKKQLIFPLKVLFEDEYLAAIHKPAGIEVSGNKFKTIANALPQNLEPSKLSDVAIPQPVHRLDYATTGILLVGKTHNSIRALNKLFEDKLVSKTYYAVTIGNMEPRGTITSEIDGKPSRSDYKVMQSVPSERFGTLNLVELSPKTGRRHQLRKHLFLLGHPILGDKDYAMEGLFLKGKGLYLHAYSLEFTHPFTNEIIHLTDELPEKFGKIFS
ncbi:RluA family pseudouridine synthase [Flagellimonas okinawensis]|uniref:RluA family pseudouridine synthase n=1 Tax=Flagellimonas okinawensis TaxID=3031324 RepID=A0ABT5XMC7_9FLAO|nr:RluA family pseudouridine synthase [[Muricauda] okinawensis]MDF0707042.1 RluA family pseudouridine synthase [[Muricauda] okinawensis]